MRRPRVVLLTVALCLFFCGVKARADFNEKNWEKYAEINVPTEGQVPALGAISIEPWLFGPSNLADLRVLTGSMAEVPYQIVTRRPETKTDTVPVKMLNLSLTRRKDTSFMGCMGSSRVVYNQIEIDTDDQNFYRQVQLSGSADGKQWNLIRRDSVIFSYQKEESVRHLNVDFSDSDYKYIQVRILNKGERPLNIKGVKVFYQKKEPGMEMPVGASISKEEDAQKKESTVFVNFYYNYPVAKLNIMTNDKNFQRKVEVFAKDNAGNWVRCADGVIFNFDTAKINESGLSIDVPEISTKEIKLVIINHDSPPLRIYGVGATGYGKYLVFKLGAPQKYFLFWGDPFARAPQYDMAELIDRNGAGNVRTFSLGEQKANPKFAGYEKNLPFSERYKYVLYVIVFAVILGLIFLQYSVIKKTGGHDNQTDYGSR